MTTPDFEKATRANLLFESDQYIDMTIFDVWHIPLDKGITTIKGIANRLQDKTGVASESSGSNWFDETTESVSELDKLRMDVLKYIYDVRTKEEKEAKELRDTRKADQARLALLAEREFSAQLEDINSLDADAVRKEMAEIKARLAK